MDWVRITRALTRIVSGASVEQLDDMQSIIEHWLHTITLERKIRAINSSKKESD